MVRFKSSHPEHQKYEDAVRLVPAVARSAVGGRYYVDEDGVTTNDSTLSATFEVPGDIRGLAAILKCSNVESLVGDTLDVYIQTRIGGTWEDVIHFTQIVGTDANTIGHIDKIVAGIDQADWVFDAALAAGAKRHVFGDLWRACWDIADGGGTHSFTFTVDLIPQ